MTRINDAGFRLRDQPDYTPPTLPGHLKLGRLGRHTPKLKLADYIDKTVAAPPAAIQRPHPGFHWGMLGNDTLGDCVIAMMLHSIEDFHLSAGTAPPRFTKHQAIGVYSAITGYVPGKPSTDLGTDESAAMTYWQSPGLSTNGTTHTIAGTVAVNPSDLTECRIAIDEFVDLQVGIGLPTTAQGQTEWTVVGNPATDPNSAPGSWGGHGIPYREYDEATFNCVTWGTELLLTTEFHLDYADEAHVVVTQEMLSKSGVGPSGVQWSELLTDLEQLNAATA